MMTISWSLYVTLQEGHLLSNTILSKICFLVIHPHCKFPTNISLLFIRSYVIEHTT